MSTESTDKSIPVETIITIAIAIISLTGAMMGILTGGRSRAIIKYENQAIAAAINLEQADVISHTWMFQDLRAYAEYQRLSELSSLIDTEAEVAQARGDTSRAEILHEQAKEYRTAAQSKATFFAPEYVLPDGTFDENGFLANQMRFATRNLDTNPEVNFAKAEALIAETSVLMNGIYSFSFVVAFLIFAKVTKSKWRFVFLTIGCLLFIADLVYLRLYRF